MSLGGSKAKQSDKTMTKKQFIALADYLRGAKSGHPIMNREVIGSLADFCASQNPQFNRERWLGYIYGWAGVNGGKTKR